MTVKEGGPKSWAEDLNSYRSTRGSRSLSTVNEAGVPKRFPRTNYVPFGETTHKLYPYDMFRDGQDTIRVDPDINSQRIDRHGWGDLTLIKECGFEDGQPRPYEQHPHGKTTKACGKGQPGKPVGPDGRSDLFGVMQMTDMNGIDSWIGNKLIEPTKGKRPVLPPQDNKGRRDLFDVLHARNPGVPADDSWLGNQLIDPAKGKAKPPGPEQIRGRRDLTDIYNQSILRDPRRFELLKKGADVMSDAWLGHRLIDPNVGKAPVAGVAAAEDVMFGATFQRNAPDWSDFPPPHSKQVPPPAPDTARDVLTGTARGDDWGKLGKKQLSEPVNNFTGRKDLYAHMTFKPLAKDETAKFSKAWDDSGIHTRRDVQPKPGTKEEGKAGGNPLAWQPQTRIGNFVPRGGLMQEGRTIRVNKGRTARGVSA